MLRRVLDEPRFHVPVILGFCLLLFFPFLAARDFWELENQYAEVIRVMLLDGDFAVPKVNGLFWFHSPPLYFWTASVFALVAGGAGEWSLRLPSALSATELILIFYYFVTKHCGARLAFISAVVLANSVLTVHVERHVQVNMMFYLFISISIFLSLEILVFDSHRRLYAYGVWVSMALACLTNGPAGILIPALVALSYLALSGSWKKALGLRPVTGGLVFFGVTAPWFAYLARTASVDWTQTIRSQLDFTAHGGPDHQFFFNFPLAFAPWCFLFIPAGIALWRARSKVKERLVLFYLLWFFVGIVFSAISVGEHNHYLFLAYVPTAIAVGFYLERLVSVDAADSLWRWTRYSVMFFCGLLILGGISSPAVMAYGWRFLTAPMTILGLVLIALAVCGIYAGKQPYYPALIAWMASIPVITNLVLQSFVFPFFNARKVRPFAERLGVIVRSHAGAPAAIYNQRTFHDFNYYSQIKTIDVVREPNQIAQFLDRAGPRFLLVRHNHSKDVIEGRHEGLKAILTGEIDSERWVLFYSCKKDCTSLRDATRSP